MLKNVMIQATVTPMLHARTQLGRLFVDVLTGLEAMELFLVKVRYCRKKKIETSYKAPF